MRKMIVAIICLWIASSVHAQVISTTRADVEERGGRFYLVLSGDGAEIATVCAVGDCTQGFATRLDALNEWSRLIGLAHGYAVAPIPQPMQASAASAAVQVSGLWDHYPCKLRPCIYPPPPKPRG